MKWKPIWHLTMIGAAMALSVGIAAGGPGDLDYIKLPTGNPGGACHTLPLVTATMPMSLVTLSAAAPSKPKTDVSTSSCRKDSPGPRLYVC